MKVMLVTKNMDSGTGTFLLSLLDGLSHYYSIRALALEKPSFRRMNNKYPNISYLFKAKTYPSLYSISPSNLTLFIKSIVWIKNQTQKIKPDVIICIDYHVSILILLLKICRQINTIKIIINTQINIYDSLNAKAKWPLNSILLSLIKRLFSQADLHVCVSQQLSEDISKRFQYNAKHTVIYNGIPLRKSSPKKLGERVKIITISRLDEQKDIGTLLRALHLINDVKRVELNIIGDGEKKLELIALAEKLELQGRVRFLGWQNDVGKYLLRSDIFVLSSKREGFGFVLVEAMNYGLPIISTNAPFGPAEILGDGKYGVLVPVGNDYILSQKIRELIADTYLYSIYSKKSLLRVKDFSAFKTISRYREEIVKLTSCHR